jgi:hypothetical protein
MAHRTEQEYELYEIRVRGHVAPRRLWDCEGLSVKLEPNGEMLIVGPIVDQAALHGLLIRIRDLGVPLLSVNRLAHKEEER